MIHKGEKMKLPVNKDFIRKFDLFGMGEKMFNLVAKYVTPEMSILDVGTGRGVATRFLVKKLKSGGMVYSIDLSDEMQKIVAEILEEENLMERVKFQVANVESLPFEDDFFDLVLSMNSIHHFSNLDKALSEMKRVLKKGGTLCIIDWSKKARFLPHKTDDMFNLEDFKEYIDDAIAEEHAERMWWFLAIKK